MPNGYNGKILRVDLDNRKLEVEEPEEKFYRRYLGGRGLIGHYLLRELPAGVDPLGPENILIFAAGPITGVPLGGSGRNSVGAKSPLTGGWGEAEAGGHFGAELKHAGFDAIIVKGKASGPVYLSIIDGHVEIRDARHLWGKTTGESEDLIRKELGDPRVRTAQIGPAGERLVRYACVINDRNRAAGRTGMGAVMGSKNLKAVAVRGKTAVEVADAEGVKRLAKWLADNYLDHAKGLQDSGTAVGVSFLNKNSGFPTRNFRSGQFEHMSAVSGEALRDSILVGRGTCYACPIHCKREVKVEGRYSVSPAYGGPEYETIAALGSDCGVGDLEAIAKANELCNAYGLDTISTGATIAFALECFENGILTEKDTDGLRLAFGDAGAVLTLVEMIAKRAGFGDVLAEGSKRASEKIGRGAERYAVHVKGQEVPMHEPRWKQGLGLGYALSPTGADHCHNIHDSDYSRENRGFAKVRSLGLLEPLKVNDLSAKKVRLYLYETVWNSINNCLVLCNFLPWDREQVVDMVNAVTGWNTTAWELMKVGERGINLARAFNVREGFSSGDDWLPERFFEPFTDGPLAGVAIDPLALAAAKESYYGMMGWNPETGQPTRHKLQELDLEWVAETLDVAR